MFVVGIVGMPSIFTIVAWLLFLLGGDSFEPVEFEPELLLLGLIDVPIGLRMPEIYKKLKMVHL